MRHRPGARRAVAWLAGSLALACNQLTGVDDLEFRDGALPDTEQSSVSPADCDLLTGGGCESGQTCRFDAAAQVRVCRSSPLTSLEPYGLCASDDECPVGHRCQDGVCGKLCDSAAECVGSSALCLDQPETGLGLCTRPCDLVSPADPRPGLQTCGAGARCDFVSNGSYTSCFGPGSSFEAGPCQLDRDCPAAFMCVAERCTRACDESGVSCGAGLACGGIAEYAGQSVGSCCSVPTGHACDLVSDCGCAAGETCNQSFGTTNSCRAVPANPNAPNSPCSINTDCGAGHTCAGGTCDKLCKSDGDCAGVGDVCIETANADGSLNPLVKVCTRGCDAFSPFTTDDGFLACGAGTVCSPFVVNGVLISSICSSAGTGAEGSRCEANTDCAAGLLCGYGTCGRPCEVGDDSCGSSAVCRDAGIAFDDRPLGACCTIPQGQACDLVTDCGCAADEACSAVSGEGAACRPLSDSADSSVACDDTSVSCPGGHTCVNGGCAKNCRVDLDCPDVGSVCSEFITGTIPERYCSTSCNVLDPASTDLGYEPCGSGLSCTVVITADDVRSSAFTHCAIPGPVGEGGACAINPDCATGLQCLEDACVPSCLVEVDTCSNGRTCFETTPLVVVNGDTLGVCDF